MNLHMCAKFGANRSSRFGRFPTFSISDPLKPPKFPPCITRGKFLFCPLPFLGESACVCQIWSRSDHRRRRVYAWKDTHTHTHTHTHTLSYIDIDIIIIYMWTMHQVGLACNSKCRLRCCMVQIRAGICISQYTWRRPQRRNKLQTPLGSIDVQSCSIDVQSECSLGKCVHCPSVD